MDAFDVQTSLPLENVSLALVGDAGVGKSHLMAKLADEIYRRELGIEFVLVRFCGQSPDSSTSIGLLHGINAQVHYLLGKAYDREDFYSNYDETVQHFQQIMLDYAIVLFVDGLDCLQDENFGRTQLSFLKGIKLHPMSRIVVSTRPDHHDIVSNRWVSYYGCDSRLRDSNVPRERVRRFQISNAPGVEVDPSCYAIEDADENEVSKSASIGTDEENFEFTIDILATLAPVSGKGADKPDPKAPREEAVDWIKAYLARCSRTLTAAQFEDLWAAVAKDPRIVNMKLLCDIFVDVRSFDPFKLPDITVTTFDTVVAFFVNNMRLKYGNDVINSVFRFLTLSVRGLTDTEAMDLLSMDENAMKSVKVITGTAHVRFPAHVWYRLRHDFGILTHTFEDGCIAWANRAIREAARGTLDKFVSRETHKIMAFYFVNIVEPNIKTKLQLQSQPLYRSTNGSIWSRYPLFNRRRCLEAAHHMLRADMSIEAMTEMCDVEAVCARARTGLGYFFLAQMVRFENSYQHPRVEHYNRWLSRSMFKIIADPTIYLLMTCSEQPLISTARRDMMVMIHGGTAYCDFSRDAWVRCVQVGGKQDFGALINKLEGHHHKVSGVCWSADGSMLLSCSWDKSICIWNPHAGTLIGVCEGHGAAVTSVSWNPDSLEFASASWDNTVAIWDVHSGQVVRVFDEHQDFVCVVAWSPNKQYIASGSYDKTVRLWSPNDCNSLHVLEGHDNWVTSLAWSPDSFFLASGSYDHKIMLWTIMYGTWKQTYSVHAGAVLTLSWSPDGKYIASGSVDKTVVVWNVEKAVAESTVHDLPNAVNSVSWHNDSNRLAIGSADRLVRVYNFSSRSVEGVQEGHSDVVSSVCWSNNGSTLVSASADNMICLWDTEHLNRLVVSDCHSSDVLKVVWSPDDRYIASCSSDNTIIIWDAQYSKLLSRLNYHSKDVVDICWSPDCRYLLSCSLDSKAVTWDCSSGLPFRVDRYGDKIYYSAVAWSRQSTLLTYATSIGAIRIIDFKTGAITKTLSGHNSCVSSLQFSPVAYTTLLSGSNDTTVCVWEAQDGILLHKFNAHKNWVTGVSWHPDGQVVASCSLDKTVKLWSVETGKQLEENYTHSEALTCVKWNKDGNRVAFSSADKYVYIWNTTLPQASAFPLRGHDQDANAVDWNDRGIKLVSCSADKTIRVWDAVKLGATVDREIELQHHV
jgi:WD40 repeat protein